MPNRRLSEVYHNGKQWQSFQRQFKNTTKIRKCQAIFINLVKESFSLVKGLVKEKSPCDFNAPRIAQNSVQEQFQPHSSAGTSHSRSFQTFRIVGALLKTAIKLGCFPLTIYLSQRSAPSQSWKLCLRLLCAQKHLLMARRSQHRW